MTITAAYILFIASMLLPASNTLAAAGTSPGTPLTGWQAFMAIRALGAQPLAFVFEPRSLLLLVLPLLNLIMFLSPLVIVVYRQWSFWLAFLFVPGALLPFLLPKTLTGDLFIGFYAWIASFFLMGAGCIWLTLGSLRWPRPRLPVSPDPPEPKSGRAKISLRKILATH